MKKILYFLTMALALIVVSSCSEDDVVYNTAPRAAFTMSEAPEG